MTTLRLLGRRAVVPILAIVTAFIVGAIVIILTDFDEPVQARAPTRRRDRRRGRRRRQRPTARCCPARSAIPARILTALADRQPDGHRGGHPPDHRDARRRDPADLHRPRGRDLVPRPACSTSASRASSSSAPSAPRSRRSRSRARCRRPLILVVAIVGGRRWPAAFWGFIPGFLKARTGAHEVITTIMLNYVASQIVLLRPALRLPAQGGQHRADLEGLLDFVRHPA